MSGMVAGILALKKKKEIYFDAQVCISFFGKVSVFFFALFLPWRMPDEAFVGFDGERKVEFFVRVE